MDDAIKLSKAVIVSLMVKRGWMGEEGCVRGSSLDTLGEVLLNVEW